jgi:hypothetical protein
VTHEETRIDHVELPGGQIRFICTPFLEGDIRQPSRGGIRLRYPQLLTAHVDTHNPSLGPNLSADPQRNQSSPTPDICDPQPLG